MEIDVALAAKERECRAIRQLIFRSDLVREYGMIDVFRIVWLEAKSRSV